MDAKTKSTINDAVERLTMSLRTEHWQALVMVRGGNIDTPSKIN